MPQQQGASGDAAIASIPGVAVQSLQLEALQQRRELLSEQYQQAMSQRGNVGQERMNAQARGDASMVREYAAVVERLGARMQELERTIQGVDQQIDRLMASPVQADVIAPAEPGAAAEPMPITVVPPMSFDFGVVAATRAEYQRMMVAEGAVLLLLGAVLWRLGVSRGRRLVSRVEAPRDDAKLQQSIDAIAIEVERLSEGQRFINNVMAGRRPDGEALPARPLPVVEPRDANWITPH